MPMRYFPLNICKPAASPFDADFLDFLLSQPPFLRNSHTLKENTTSLQCSQTDRMSEQVQPKVTSVNIMQRIRCMFLLFLFVSCLGVLQVWAYTYVCALMDSCTCINFIVCGGGTTILHNRPFSALLSERSMKIASPFPFCTFTPAYH